MEKNKEDFLQFIESITATVFDTDDCFGDSPTTVYAGTQEELARVIQNWFGTKKVESKPFVHPWLGVAQLREGWNPNDTPEPPPPDTENDEFSGGSGGTSLVLINSAPVFVLKLDKTKSF